MIFEKNFPDMIIRVGRDGEYLEIMSPSENVLFAPKNELLGKKIGEILPLEVSKLFLEGITGSLENKEIRLLRYNLNVPAGNLWFEARIIPQNDEVIAIIRDITEIVKARKALELSNKKLKLLSSITRHDVTNHLMASNGYIDLAREASNDISQIKFLEEASKANRIIQKRLDFIRVYEEIGNLDLVWHGLAELLLGEDPNITVNNQCKNIKVLADSMFPKVFDGLLDNSLRHGKATKVKLHCKEIDQGLIIIWEDNGIGIAKDKKHDLFDGGFGINIGFGLYIIKEILNLSGILIIENGIPGKGARFEMLVPKSNYIIEGG